VPLNTPANDWAALDRALSDLAASGGVEVREDGEWLAELATLHFELRVERKNPLVHLWSDERNLTRRILRVKEVTGDRIVLEVQRFGRAKPGRLEFLLTDSPRAAGRITREQFRARFTRILAEKFPDAVVDSLTASPDLENSFSGSYVRGIMHEGSHAWALLAAAPSEDAATIENILAFGILWLEWTRTRAERRAIEGLRFFVPQGTSQRLRERLLALSASTRAEIYEMRDPDAAMQKIDPADAGNLESWLVPRDQVESALYAASATIVRVRAMLPNNADAIQCRVPAGANEVALAFHGMQFARWTRQGVFFGLGNSTEQLTTANERALERLLLKLDLHRSPLAADTNHTLYRAAAERWLESIVLEDPAKLDARLDARHFYSQVPALAAGDRGVLDLLGITRQGRLVVIELKASEDLQLPMQAVDYWLRVRRHQREADFQRDGYFPGVVIDPQPPLVWLVSPGLRFHSATDTLLKYLSPEIRVTRIGLAENWRCSLKIIFRQ
jgi:DNA-binding transcriptional ArsR family regulator